MKNAKLTIGYCCSFPVLCSAGMIFTAESFPPPSTEFAARSGYSWRYIKGLTAEKKKRIGAD
jgi:hypothetical protein